MENPSFYENARLSGKIFSPLCHDKETVTSNAFLFILIGVMSNAVQNFTKLKLKTYYKSLVKKCNKGDFIYIIVPDTLKLCFCIIKQLCHINHTF